MAHILFVPAAVQGEAAPAQLADALALVNEHALLYPQDKADLIIIGRGGGTLEDLWAFNTELVARAIFNSVIPVISAVGHEPDVTIADFVADMRASTPSHAAELAVIDKTVLQDKLQQYTDVMAHYLRRFLQVKGEALDRMLKSRIMQQPHSLLQLQEQRFDFTVQRLSGAMQRMVSAKAAHHGALCARLEACDPLRVLKRGYAIVEKDSVPVIKGEQLRPQDRVHIRMQDSTLSAVIEDIVQ